MDTIAALSTPEGFGALGVVRVSGPKVKELIIKVCKESRAILSSVREQVYSEIRFNEEIIDYSLCTFFEGPKSYTGEDLLEVSLHGSPLIIRKFLRLTLDLGIRKAEPGEFTRRAFLNGKLDLVQAEAVHDLIVSETESQLKAAQNQLVGILSDSILKLGEPLRDLLAEIEAHIDFPEEDISPEKSDSWIKVIDKVLSSINQYISSFDSGKLIKEGILVPIVGIPNAGKSSLLNALLEEDRAIVTNIPGTTRDYLEERINLEGYLIRLVDTAGLADQISEDRIIDTPELFGIKRSREFIEKGDLVIFLFDPTTSSDDALKQEKILEEIKLKNLLVVINKEDLLSKVEKSNIENKFKEYDTINISTLNKIGLSELKKKVLKLIGLGKISNQVLVTSERQRDALILAKESLNNALTSIKVNQTEEYISFELRTTLNYLNEIVGITETEDILGRIFSKFCIGK